MVDANAAYTIADAAHLARLDAFDLMMIEQPLDYDDVMDHAQLQRQLKTPICLDESIKTVHDRARRDCGRRLPHHQHQAGRVGGFAESMRLHDLCAGARHSGLARRHARVRNRPRRQHSSVVAAEFLAAGRHRRQQALLRSRISSIRRSRSPRDGTIPVPTGPGIGVTIREDRVDAATIKRAQFGA